MIALDQSADACALYLGIGRIIYWWYKMIVAIFGDSCASGCPSSYTRFFTQTHTQTATENGVGSSSPAEMMSLSPRTQLRSNWLDYLRHTQLLQDNGPVRLVTITPDIEDAMTLERKYIENGSLSYKSVAPCHLVSNMRLRCLTVFCAQIVR